MFNQYCIGGTLALRTKIAGWRARLSWLTTYLHPLHCFTNTFNIPTYFTGKWYLWYSKILETAYCHPPVYTLVILLLYLVGAESQYRYNRTFGLFSFSISLSQSTPKYHVGGSVAAVVFIERRPVPSSSTGVQWNFLGGSGAGVWSGGQKVHRLVNL